MRCIPAELVWENCGRTDILWIIKSLTFRPNQPFTPPSIMPLVKYFCTNG